MSTDTAIQAEATYRTSRRTEGVRRPGLRRTIVRWVWRPSGLAALMAAVRGALGGDDATREIMAASRISTDVTTGHA